MTFDSHNRKLVTKAMLLALASSTSDNRADLVFEEGYTPLLKDQGPKTLLLAMSASQELQRAFQRLHPGPRAFVSTDYSFS